MKLVFFFLLLSSNLVWAGQTYAQIASLNLDLNNVPLEEVFDAIRKQSEFEFFYNNDQVNTSMKVSVKAKNADIYAVLEQALPDIYEYKINDRYILVNKRREVASVMSVQNQRQSEQTKKTITGTVTDKNGEAIIGANIVEKGTTNGTVTDVDGRFSLSVENNTTLRISYIGYLSQEIEIAGRTSFNITLREDTQALDEVVVVGYGSQKRASVIGSVATISAASIDNRSVSTLSSSLAGLAAGVNVQTTTGKPGADGASVLIRGTGTLNSTSPLVVIDGIVGSMDAVNPNDVESISILKDAATAAIYGSLGSNGVILITTKKGNKGKTSVSYTGMASMLRPNNVPEFVTDYARHMRLVNEGFTNLGQAAVYTDATIAKWEEAAKNPDGLTEHNIPNYVAYPNTNWGNVLFGQRKLLQNHNVMLNGGTENTQYMFSVGYFDNPGTMSKTGADKIRLRINLQSKVAKFLTVGTQTFGDIQNTSVADVVTAYSYLTQTVPGVYPVYDGRYGFPAAAEESATANNALAYLHGQGGRNQVNRINTTIFAKIDLYKGLDFETKVHYNNSYTENNTHPIPYEKWNFATNQLSTAAQNPAQMSTRYSLYKNYNLIIDNVLRYNGTFDKHEFGGILGYNSQYFNLYNFDASKLGLIHPDLTTLNSGTTMTGINGDEVDYGLQSVFGRLNYAYNNRYLGEIVVRHDGSSRFGRARRWGTFPAFSLGWRISDEPFMEATKRYLDDLRIRASWGRTGNNAAGNYDHLPAYGTVAYSFNDQPIRGLAQTKLGNDQLHWEATTTTNLGLTGSFFNGKMNVEFDVYRAYTDGILFVPNIPAILGTAKPATMNIAEVSKRGLELSLSYSGNVKDFHYSIGGNFAYNTNRVEKYKGRLQEGFVKDTQGNNVYQSNIGQVSNGTTTRILEGHAIQEYYLYNIYQGSGGHFLPDGSVDKDGGPKDGMIRTPADMAWLEQMIATGYTFQPADGIDPTKIWYGDLIYADLNDDGIYGNVYDQAFTGKRATPAYNFGLTFNLAYKGFDASMIWSAATGMSYYWNTLYLNQSTVAQGKSVPVLVADNHYYYNMDSPNDPTNNINGHYPRLKGVTDAQNGRTSNFYFYNASYAKLRNLQIGYTVPSTLASRFSISKLRLYVAGENLLTFTKFPGLDPEIGPDANYPTMRQYALGLNVTF